MRTIIIFLSLVALFTTIGCDPVNQVRKMREADRQKQEENNERQLKKAMENFALGSTKGDDPTNEPNKP